MMIVEDSLRGLLDCPRRTMGSFVKVFLFISEDNTRGPFAHCSRETLAKLYLFLLYASPSKQCSMEHSLNAVRPCGGWGMIVAVSHAIFCSLSIRKHYTAEEIVRGGIPLVKENDLYSPDISHTLENMR